MKLKNISGFAISIIVSAASVLTGCELITAVDRDRSDDGETGSTGGNGGNGGNAGNGGNSDNGGDSVSGGNGGNGGGGGSGGNGGNGGSGGNPLSGTLVNAESFQGAGNQAAYAIASSGNAAVVAGWFDGDINLFGASFDCATVDCIFVANRGPTPWQKTFSRGAGVPLPVGLAKSPQGKVALASYFTGEIDLGGGILEGDAASNLFVGVWDANANHVWSKVFKASKSTSWSQPLVAFDGETLWVGTSFAGSIDLGAGPLDSAGNSDIVLAHFDQNGNISRNRSYGDLNTQALRDLKVASGKILMTGFFDGTLNFGGAPLTAAGLSDGFAVMVDQNIDEVWGLRVGGEGDAPAKRLGVGSQKLVIAGHLLSGSTLALPGGDVLKSGGADNVYLLWLDLLTGEVEEGRVFESASPHYVWGAEMNNLDETALVIELFKEVDFGGGLLTSTPGKDSDDVAIVTFNADRTHRRSARFGDEWSQYGYDCTLTEDLLTVVGRYTGSVDFGNGALPTTGQGDGNGFIAEFVP